MANEPPSDNPPADLGDARSRRDADKAAQDLKGTIDTTKYNAAVRQQQGGPQTMSDLARDIVARNWDNIIQQKPLPDEDRNTLNLIVKSSHYFTFMNLEIAMSSAQQDAKIPFNKMVVTLNPDARAAYIHNDPSHNTFRIRAGNNVQAYGSRRERDIAALSMLDPSIFDPKKLAQIEKTLQEDPTHDAEMEFESTFDPQTETREYPTQILARFEKIEKHLVKIAQQNDKSLYLIPKQYDNGDTQDTRWELSVFDTEVELSGATPEENSAGLGFGTSQLLNMTFSKVEEVEAYLEQHAVEIENLLLSRFRIVDDGSLDGKLIKIAGPSV